MLLRRLNSRLKSMVCVVLAGSILASSAVHAGPKAFLEAVDKAMKDYAADIQAEGESNLATIKTVGGKLLRPTKWKELGGDIDAGFKNYSGALIKTGDNALANTKAMVKVLLSVRTYIPDFILKAWDAAVARFKEAAGGVSGGDSAAWENDPATPAAGDGGGDDGALPGGLPSVDDAPAASAIRRPGRTLSRSDRDRLLEQWVQMRTSAASLIRMSGKAKPDGRTQVVAAMQSTEQTVRAHDRTLIRHLGMNPRACLDFVRSLERLDREELLVMSDVVGQLNRVYVSKARARKVDPDVKSAVEALGKLKQKLAKG